MKQERSQEAEILIGESDRVKRGAFVLTLADRIVFDGDVEAASSFTGECVGLPELFMLMGGIKHFTDRGFSVCVFFNPDDTDLMDEFENEMLKREEDY